MSDSAPDDSDRPDGMKRLDRRVLLSTGAGFRQMFRVTAEPLSMVSTSPDVQKRPLALLCSEERMETPTVA